jgi:peptide chain release factor
VSWRWGSFLEALLWEFPETLLLDKVEGPKKGTLRSATLGTERDLGFLEGTVLWVCKSPYRPHHGRKNWYIDISVLKSDLEESRFSLKDVEFQSFRSSGKGGQHVNKVETGVRAIHLPTGLSVVATAMRSQHLNKESALKRLKQALLHKDALERASVKAENRLEHTRLIRGKPVRIYHGLDFIRKEHK